LKNSFSWDIVLAISVFIGGLLFYALLRPPTIVANWLKIRDLHINTSWLTYVNWFPSFSHVFSFTLLTWIVLNRTKKNFSLFLWVTLNLLYEWGQLSSKLLPPLLQKYFITGTFDIYDVLAIFCGGLMALVVMRRFS